MNYIHFNNFRLLPQALSTSANRIFFKNDHYRSRPSRDNLLIAAPNSNVFQKSTRYSVQLSICMLIYDLFISFSVRYRLISGLHSRSNGTYHGLETFVQ